MNNSVVSGLRVMVLLVSTVVGTATSVNAAQSPSGAPPSAQTPSMPPVTPGDDFDQGNPQPERAWSTPGVPLTLSPICVEHAPIFCSPDATERYEDAVWIVIHHRVVDDPPVKKGSTWYHRLFFFWKR